MNNTIVNNIKTQNQVNLLWRCKLKNNLPRNVNISYQGPVLSLAAAHSGFIHILS